MKGKSKLNQRTFDFIIQNRGKILQEVMSKRFGVSRSYISMVQLFNLRYGITTLQQFKDQNNRVTNTKYQTQSAQQKERSWENQVDEGIEIYHFVMRRHRLPRKIVYERLIAEMKEQRLQKAA